MLIGLVTVSIGEPSARLADPSSGPATAAQEWGVSVIESGEFQVIVTKQGHPPQGCQPRAHVMALQAEDMGVTHLGWSPPSRLSANRTSSTVTQ